MKFVIAAFATLVVAEATLQCIGYYQQWAAHRRITASAISVDGKARPIVAFVGDSNIYGLYVEDDQQTLPKWVERLSRRDGALGIQSVNYALPASPSWAVAEQCERALKLKPKAVVVRCGINNTWTRRPSEGLGFLESFKLVRMTRLALYTWKGGKKEKAQFGVHGAPVEDSAVRIGTQEAMFTLRNREGQSAPFQVAMPGTNASIEEIAPQIRADIDEMARRCEAASAKLILASYLAGDEGAYGAIRRIMSKQVRGTTVYFADCGMLLDRAVNRPDERGAVPPDELRAARRAALITRDRHPTELGYAMESRVVAKTLADCGVTPGLRTEDPLDVLTGVRIDVPKLRARLNENKDPELLLAGVQPGDGVSILFGNAGSYLFKELTLPVDPTPLRQSMGSQAVAGVAVAPSGDGTARIPVPDAALVGRDAPDAEPLYAVAYVERGGSFGAAQQLYSAPVRIPLQK